MKLSLATKRDFRMMWRLYAASGFLEGAQYCDDWKTRERRAKAVIVGVMMKMDGAFIRVVMGCEMFIKAAQDPAVDFVALKPLFGAAPKVLTALRTLHTVCERMDAEHDGDRPSEDEYQAAMAGAAAALGQGVRHAA